MSRYTANIITKSPATPTGPTTAGRAPGIWRMDDVAYWTRQGLWPNANIVPDIYFPYVSLLLSTTSLGNANNSLFVDSSGAFTPISRNGTPTQGSFTPYSKNWSNSFDGSGDYFTVPYTTANFDWWTSGTDFTIEYWFFANSSTGISYSDAGFNHSTVVGNRSATATTDYWSFGPTSAGTVTFYYFNGGANAVTSTAIYSLNTWNHVAMTKTSSGITVFVNGVAGTTTAISGTPQSSTGVPLTVGQGNNSSFNGYVGNLRIVRGTAIYSGNFTPPTAPLTAVTNTKLLTCQSNRFRDASTNNLTLTVTGNTSVQDFGPFSPAYPGAVYNQSDITNWSGYFDGSGDWLTVPNNTALQFGSGDFTVEFWANVSTSSGFRGIIGKGGAATGWAVFIDNNNYWAFSIDNLNYAGSVTPIYGTWTHVAFTRSGTTFTLYINGTSVRTHTSSSSFTQTEQLVIGAGRDLTIPYTGSISNVRIVKGTAVYTSNFTPPTTNLTAISGTSLLTLQNAAFTDNSTNNFVITPSGNVTVTGNSPFNTVGYWSNYFDGSGDVLQLPGSSAFAIATPTTPFTIEGWIYPTAVGGCVFSEEYTGTGNSVSIAVIMSDGTSETTGRFITFGYYTGTAWVLAAVSNVEVTLNTWTHVACVFTGSTTKIYFNGVDVTKTSSPTPATTWGVTGVNGSAWFVGRRWDTTGTAYFTGYISNFRFVNGTAVYTAAFTPPTTPLTAITNTSLLTCQNGRFIDNSTNAFTITANGNTSVQSFDPFYTSTTASNGGSMYFDGSGDFLALQNNPSYALGSGDFTLDVWVYPITQGGHGSSNNDCIIDFRPGGNGAYGTLYSLNNGASINWYANTGVRITGAAIQNNAWSHLCVSRVSGNTRLFINGVQSGSTYVDSTNYLQTNPWIGQFNDSVGSGWFHGYMSGMRIVKGSGVSSNFTPPTTPYSPTPNTTLLLNGMNAGIYDAAANNDIETVGNAQVSTAVSKFGGSSMYFDGSGDYLALPPNTPSAILGTGSFTIEFWINPNPSQTSTRTPIISFGNGFTTNVWAIQLNNTSPSYVNRIQLWAYNLSSVAVIAATTGTISASTWTHVAVVRNGSNFTIYVNGVADGTGSSSASMDGGSNTLQFQVGYNAPDFYAGYIDEIRVTRGVARYTANFTPPDKAFPTY